MIIYSNVTKYSEPAVCYLLFTLLGMCNCSAWKTGQWVTRQTDTWETQSCRAYDKFMSLMYLSRNEQVISLYLMGHQLMIAYQLSLYLSLTFKANLKLNDLLNIQKDQDFIRSVI